MGTTAPAKPSLADRITDLIRAYHKLPTATPDVDRLLDLRRQLATLKFGFAVEVGQLYQERNGAEFRRKAEFARIKADHIAGGDSAAKAEAAAEIAIEELRKEESHADAMYRGAYLIHDAAKDVLDVLGQHVANVRQEKRAETTGQGSQTT
jgi:hypothetical protein